MRSITNTCHVMRVNQSLVVDSRRQSKRTRPSPARMPGYRNWMDGAERRTQERIDIQARKLYLQYRHDPPMLNPETTLTAEEQSLYARGRDLFIEDNFAAIDRNRSKSHLESWSWLMTGG